MSEIQCHRTSRPDAASVAFFSNLPDPEAFSTEVIEASPDCFKILDLFGRMEFMNRNGQCLLELTDVSGWIGRPFASMWPEAAQRQVEVAIAAARAGDTARFTAFCPTSKGAPKWWDVMVYCVEDKDRRPMKIVAISRDVTAAVRAQEELQAMLTELKGLLDVNGRLHAAAA